MGSAQPSTPAEGIAPATLEMRDANRWRFTEVNGFVVKDWTGLKAGDEPAIAVLKSADIFEFIAEASATKRKIAVYPIGACVVDWT